MPLVTGAPSIGVKSVAPFVSDLTRSGAEKAPAKSGTSSDIGPIRAAYRCQTFVCAQSPMVD
jgi:hypothetical protein